MVKNQIVEMASWGPEAMQQRDRRGSAAWSKLRKDEWVATLVTVEDRK